MESTTSTSRWAPKTAPGSLQALAPHAATSLRSLHLGLCAVRARRRRDPLPDHDDQARSVLLRRGRETCHGYHGAHCNFNGTLRRTGKAPAINARNPRDPRPHPRSPGPALCQPCRCRARAGQAGGAQAPPQGRGLRGEYGGKHRDSASVTITPMVDGKHDIDIQVTNERGCIGIFCRSAPRAATCSRPSLTKTAARSP